MAGDHVLFIVCLLRCILDLWETNSTEEGGEENNFQQYVVVKLYT